MTRKGVALIPVATAALAGAGWWYWVTTPEYSLQQMSNAIKQHDREAFGRYFDVHSVATKAVDDLMSSPVRNEGGQGLLMRVVGAAVVGWLQPVTVSKVESGIDAFVRNNGNPPEERPEEKGIVSAIVGVLRPPSLADVLRGLGFSSATYRGITKVGRAGNVAHTDLLFERSPGASTHVEMELKQQNDGSWKVVRFSNLQAVAQAVRDSSAEREPEPEFPQHGNYDKDQ
jgi:hypothetical protein